MKQIFSFCFAIILSSGHLIAQGPTVVLSQNKCDYRELENLNQTMAEISGPILNNLVDQGKLLSWGVLQHGWGDEWNWNNQCRQEGCAAEVCGHVRRRKNQSAKRETAPRR